MPVTATGNHEAGLQVRPRPRVRVPGRLLRLASDDRLVEQLRAGSEPAFEAIFDRHHRGVLAFCRHMLGSAEEAEDAVQHTFLAAYSALTRTDRPIRLRPWLYTIARNRCLSVLRSPHRPAPAEPDGPATEHLAAVVERRQDLRDLLGDLSRLPDDQRAALVLSEVGDLSHDDIADVVGCRREKVKALVFQARSSLIASRAARETPCAEIRQQLASLSGGALRRGALRRHLRDCAGCREFGDEVRAQRRELALVLPVAPSLGLKSLVLGGTGSAAGAGIGAGVGAASGSIVAKVVIAAAVAGGGTVAVETARERPASPPAAPAPVARPAATPAGAPAATAAAHPAAAHKRATPSPALPAAAESPLAAASERAGAAGGAGDPEKAHKRHGRHGRSLADLAENPHGHQQAKAVKPAGAVKPGDAVEPAKPPKIIKPAKAVKRGTSVVPPRQSRRGGSGKPHAPPRLSRRSAPAKALHKVKAAKPEKPVKVPKVVEPRVERTEPQAPATQPATTEPQPAAQLEAPETTAAKIK